MMKRKVRSTALVGRFDLQGLLLVLYGRVSHSG